MTNNRHWFWKLTCIIFGALVASAVVAPLPPADPPLQSWIVRAGVVVVAVGLYQYAFDWPRLPLLLWRVFGPLFSFGWMSAAGGPAGWVGNRLAVISLSSLENKSPSALSRWL